MINTITIMFDGMGLTKLLHKELTTLYISIGMHCVFECYTYVGIHLYMYMYIIIYNHYNVYIY